MLNNLFKNSSKSVSLFLMGSLILCNIFSGCSSEETSYIGSDFIILGDKMYGFEYKDNELKLIKESKSPKHMKNLGIMNLYATDDTDHWIVEC